jgi:hypothetical protein
MIFLLMPVNQSGVSLFLFKNTQLIHTLNIIFFLYLIYELLSKIFKI